MNEYECSTLALVMRYLDVAQAHLFLEEMDGVPRIHSARRSLAKAEEEVAKAHQAQTEAQAIVQSASSERMLIRSRLKKPNSRCRE
jgi:hypothetical protein